MKPCECGSTEFMTNLNSYDIYELVDGELEWVKSELADDELKFYCRECSEELKTS